MNIGNLTNIELGVLRELVWGVLESMQTDGNDTADNPNFVAYCNLFQKLGGTPPAPTEPELSTAARQSGIDLADSLIRRIRSQEN